MTTHEQGATATRVAVIGIGPMGGGIASHLVSSGLDVTVWNRTPEHADRIVAAGARRATSPADAVEADDLILVSLPSYRITGEVLRTPEVEAVLAGRTLVQLSSGSGRQARELADWAASHGAEYLDGSVMGYPRFIGTPDMSIIFSGSEPAFATHAPTLRLVAPAQIRVNDDPGGASALSTALWYFYYGAYGAFLETAALADRSGIGITDFLTLAEPMLTVLGDGVRDTARRVTEHDLSGDQATIDAIHRDLETGGTVCSEQGVESKVLQAFVAYLAKAREAGAGDQDPAALFAHMGLEQPGS